MTRILLLFTILFFSTPYFCEAQTESEKIKKHGIYVETMMVPVIYFIPLPTAINIGYERYFDKFPSSNIRLGAIYSWWINDLPFSLNTELNLMLGKKNNRLELGVFSMPGFFKTEKEFGILDPQIIKQKSITANLGLNLNYVRVINSESGWLFRFGVKLASPTYHMIILENTDDTKPTAEEPFHTINFGFTKTF